MARRPAIRAGIHALCALALWAPAWLAFATPANKAALDRHYDRFLAKELNRCTTCHLPSDNKSPQSLDEFPHNPFGARLRALGIELTQAGKAKDIPARLAAISEEDSDGDGVANQIELLLGHNPGDAADKPSAKERREAGSRRAEFDKFLAGYRWRPFEPVQRPPVPLVKNRRWVRNQIDDFIAAEHEARGLSPRPEAGKEILLRRVYLDLIGLTPTPAEQDAFLNDKAPDAYEKVVERLLADPRHGERWARHWMDVWRYSDWAGWTDGNQVRDSKPHIWRWRDWIVESLNANKPYDQMLIEMLAADELAPEDPQALRATGFLARNYKMLSREQWLEDTVHHTAQAFLGLTLHCAKCHDHQVDPIAQAEYYQVRAIFEPHQVRTDRLPGQTNTALDGLVRVFDVATNPPTWLFLRGDERHPDTNHLIQPGVPQALGGALQVQPVTLPRLAAHPDRREFVVRDILAAADKALADAREALVKLQTNSAADSGKLTEQELAVVLAEARREALVAVIAVEKIEDTAGKKTEEWRGAATNAVTAQRRVAVAEAKLKLHLARVTQTAAQTKADEAAKTVNEKKEAAEKATKDLEGAKKKFTDAEKVLAEAEKEQTSPAGVAYKPRSTDDFPDSSTGRRLAFARWVAEPRNPLTARVAANQIWLRHFGRGIVPTPADFGRNGRLPSHPQLLDWLAAELMDPAGAVEAEPSDRPARRFNASTLQRFNASTPWSMKHLHRLIVTSATYRQASTPDAAGARLDPDNVYLWRMNSRRLEAELVRDNVLWVAGNLELTMGGPDIDHNQGLTSKRRSLYLRQAAEKEVEFLRIFDGPSVTECYERRPSVMPQQALALANSELAFAQARVLAAELRTRSQGDDALFVAEAFRRVLSRSATREEARLCREFLNPSRRDAVTAEGAIPTANVRQPFGVASTVTSRAESSRRNETPSVAQPPTAPSRDLTVAATLSTSGGKAPPESAKRSRENLLLILLNHNDFLTVR
jgi:hypothetical protein